MIFYIIYLVTVPVGNEVKLRIISTVAPSIGVLETVCDNGFNVNGIAELSGFGSTEITNVVPLKFKGKVTQLEH